MKTMIPNQLINLQTNLKFEKSSEPMRIKVLLLLLLVTICTSVSAQRNLDSDETLVVKEIDSYLNSQGAMRRTSETANSGVKNLEDLILNNQSSVYLNSGSVTTYGEKPKNLYTDLNSLNQITNAQFIKDYVEIVIVSVKNSAELSRTFDTSLLSSLKKLKYVYLVFDVNVTESNVARMIRNNNDKYSFFYKITNKS